MTILAAVPHELPEPRKVTGRVVGIDPGLGVTGYAVIEPRAGRRVALVEAGVIRGRGEKQPLAERLRTIHEGLLEVLDEYPPDCVAIELVHSHARFPATAIQMAHARGVIMLAASLRRLEVHGYPAARIKKTLTGSGRAPKEQMQHAIQTELGLDRLPEPHDVADACAVALCHFGVARNLRGLAGF